MVLKDINYGGSYSAKLGTFLRQYKLHSTNKRIVKKTFPRRKVVCTYQNQVMMGDLIVWPDSYRFQNNNYRYILVVVGRGMQYFINSL